MSPWWWCDSSWAKTCANSSSLSASASPRGSTTRGRSTPISTGLRRPEASQSEGPRRTPPPAAPHTPSTRASSRSGVAPASTARDRRPASATPAPKYSTPVSHTPPSTVHSQATPEPPPPTPARAVVRSAAGRALDPPPVEEAPDRWARGVAPPPVPAAGAFTGAGTGPPATTAGGIQPYGLSRLAGVQGRTSGTKTTSHSPYTHPGRRRPRNAVVMASPTTASTAARREARANQCTATMATMGQPSPSSNRFSSSTSSGVSCSSRRKAASIGLTAPPYNRLRKERFSARTHSSRLTSAA